MHQKILIFFLSAQISTSASAVILSKEVKVKGKIITKCIIDTSKLSISKTSGLIDEVGEIADARLNEVRDWMANVEKEPSISETQGALLVASAAPDEVVVVTIKDKQTVVLRGKNADDKPAFIRVGPKTTKLMEFIEKHCR